MKGPQGQKRPADDGKDKAAQSMGRRGGAARRDKLTPERRADIARKAAATRWQGRGEAT